MLVIRVYCGADALMEAVRMSMLCKRRLLFLEVVRIQSAPCVLYRKIRMRMTRMSMRARMTMRAMCYCKMRATCHYKMRATCSRREGSLQDPSLNPRSDISKEQHIIQKNPYTNWKKKNFVLRNKFWFTSVTFMVFYSWNGQCFMPISQYWKWDFQKLHYR